MKNKKTKEQEAEHREKWQNISEKTDHAHKNAIQRTEDDAELKRKSGDPDKRKGNTREEDWQKLNNDESLMTRGRRGGYPKNVYSDKKNKKKPE